ncbi:MAG: NADAR family protein [Oscillospiraceae bacterium]|nr:NADAR family protein [Oscillospiraceae bacterium]
MYTVEGFDRNSVVERYNCGEEIRFIFFWGHSARPGEIKKSCLSQWYPCSFTQCGVNYYTTEQYMMAQKALLFDDRETYEKIMQADNPKAYKALGREIRGFNEDVWSLHKYGIVLQGNIAKFSQNPGLKDFLLKTGDSVLAEASPYDSVWGVGLAMDDPAIGDPNNWRGENLLGAALMETRRVLSAAEAAQSAPGESASVKIY